MHAEIAAGDQLWFLGTLVRVWVSCTKSGDGISVLEHVLPFGNSPPLHIHRTEDEVFEVLAGEVRFLMDGKEFRLKAGEVVLAPRGSVHTYRVESRDGGRFRTVTVKGDFEKFVRAMSVPAERGEMPPEMGPPTAELMAHLTAVAAKHGIEFVGPPLG